MSLLQDHTTLRCRSLDRLYLNAYIPELQRPEQVRRFLERETTPIASPALFRLRSEAFVRELRACAEGQGAPWIVFERGERKEDRMRPLLEAAAERVAPGLVAVGVAQERTTAWKGAKRALDRGGFTFGFSRVSVYVNQHYCYLWDADWGPAFIKLSGYAPWGGRVWLNGHEWAKRQLARRGVAYEALDNGFRSVADPDALDAMTASLGGCVRKLSAPRPARIERPVAGWAMARDDPSDAVRGGGYGGGGPHHAHPVALRAVPAVQPGMTRPARPTLKSLARSWTAQTSCHSAHVLTLPRRLKRRKPRASLFWPKTGSTMTLRRA
jgi:hypothetical protein